MLKKLLSLVILNLFNPRYCFVKFSPVEENTIINSEAKVRDTLNSILDLFHIQTHIEKHLQKYLVIHNHLLAITLQTYEVAKDISTGFQNYDKNNLTDALADEINILDDETLLDGTIFKLVKDFLTDLDHNTRVNGKDIVLEAFVQNELILSNREDEDESKESSESADTSDVWIPPDFASQTRRIFEGEGARIRIFPFMVVVLVFKQFYCAGSIISADTVITAASCLQIAWNNKVFRDNPTFLTVRVGSSYYAAGGELLSVKQIHFHPHFDSKTLKNNICLLRLTMKLNLTKEGNKKVKKLEYDRANATLLPSPNGVTIVGWGARSHATTFLTLVEPLAFSRLDVYSLGDCQDIYSKEFVTETNFCAGFVTKGGGACNHDVGAPGIVGGVLTGIVTFGSPMCGTPDAPTVFTKIGYYSHWIDAFVGEHKTVRRTKVTTTTKRTKSNKHKKKLSETSNSMENTTTEGKENDDEIYLSFVKTLQAKDLMEVFNAKNSSEDSNESDSYQNLQDKELEEKRKQVLMLLKDLATTTKKSKKNKQDLIHKTSKKVKASSTTKRKSHFEDRNLFSSSGSKEFLDLIKGKLLNSKHTTKDRHHHHNHKKHNKPKSKVITPQEKIETSSKKIVIVTLTKPHKKHKATDKPNDKHEKISDDIRHWINFGSTSTPTSEKVFEPELKFQKSKEKDTNIEELYDYYTDDEIDFTLPGIKKTEDKAKNDTKAYNLKNSKEKEPRHAKQELPVSFDYYEENYEREQRQQSFRNQNIKTQKPNKHHREGYESASEDVTSSYDEMKTNTKSSSKRIHLMFANNFDNVFNYFSNDSSNSSYFSSQSLYNVNSTIGKPANDTEPPMSSLKQEVDDRRRNKNKNEFITSKSLIANAFRHWLSKNSENSESVLIAQKSDDDLYELLKVAIERLEDTDN